MNPKNVVKASKWLLGGTAVLSVASFLSAVSFPSAALVNIASSDRPSLSYHNSCNASTGQPDSRPVPPRDDRSQNNGQNKLR